MAQITTLVTKDALLARRLSDGTDLGAGKDHHLGVGRVSDGTHILRSLLGVPMPDWDDLGATKLDSLVLRVKVRTAHSSRGSAPRFYVRLLGGSWSEGSHGGQGGGDPSDETWSPSNASVYPGPNSLSAGVVDANDAACSPNLDTLSAGDVVDIEITSIGDRLIPATMLRSDGVTPGDDLMNYGIVLYSFDTGSSSRYIEFDSSDGSYAPRFVWTYSTNSKPTGTVTTPAASGTLARLTMQSRWNSPRLVVDHSYSDPRGKAQGAYRYTVWASNQAGTLGAQLYTSGEVIGDDTGPFVLPLDLTNGAYYQVGVEVKNVNASWSDPSTKRNVRVRWARGAYVMDTGISPPTLSGWSFEHTAAGVSDATGGVFVEFGSNTSAAAPAGYTSVLGAVALARYFHYRVWLMAWGAAGGAGPTLTDATLEVVQGVASLDGWALGTGASVDQSEYQYGTQCLRIDGVASNPGRSAYAGSVTPHGQRPILIKPETVYRLSGRIKQSGAAGGRILLLDQSDNLLLTAMPSGNPDGAGWDSIVSPAWDSAGVTSVKVVPWMNGGAGTVAWFDSIQLEASPVVTPWRPGLVGSGVAIDLMGIQIKPPAVFRLVGGTHAQDFVELETMGLAAQMALLRAVSAPSGNPGTDRVGIWYDADDARLKLRLSSGTDVVLARAIGGTNPVGTVLESYLTGDVSMGTAGTEYPTSGNPSVTLTAGIWRVDGTCVIASGSNGVNMRTASHLRNTTAGTYLAESQDNPASIAGVATVAGIQVGCVVDATGGDQTIRLVAKADVAATLKANNQNYSSATNRATGITAVRIA